MSKRRLIRLILLAFVLFWVGWFLFALLHNLGMLLFIALALSPLLLLIVLVQGGLWLNERRTGNRLAPGQWSLVWALVLNVIVAAGVVVYLLHVPAGGTVSRPKLLSQFITCEVFSLFWALPFAIEELGRKERRLALGVAAAVLSVSPFFVGLLSLYALVAARHLYLLTR